MNVVVGAGRDLPIRDDDGKTHAVAKQEALVPHRPMTDPTVLLAQGVLSDVVV